MSKAPSIENAPTSAGNSSLLTNNQNGQDASVSSQQPAVNQTVDYPIIPNAMVEVLPRTWPGINKVGGIARVVKCHFIPDEDSNNANNGEQSQVQSAERTIPKPTHIDVRYIVMGGREKNVPMEYCRPAPQYDDAYQKQIRAMEMQSAGETTATDSNNNINPNGEGGERSKNIRLLGSSRKMRSLRDRSALLGRCNLCGSLRSDCGSCDWVEEERKRREEQERNNQDGTQPSISDLNQETKENRRGHGRRRRRKRIIQKTSLLVGDSDDDSDNDDYSSSSSRSLDNSSDESYVLRNNHAKIAKQKRPTFLSSSSESESGDDSSSDEDDEILARLKNLPSVKIKEAKKKARKMAKLLKQSGNGDKKKAGGKSRKKRLRRSRYKMSNESFKARMRFLDDRIGAMKKREGRLNNNAASVLESVGNIGTTNTARDSQSVQVRERSRSDPDQNGSESGKKYGAVLENDISNHVQKTEKNHLSSTEVPDSNLQKSCAKESRGHDSIDFHCGDTESTVNLDPMSRSNEVDGSLGSQSVNGSSSGQNNVSQRRIGFVDGDDIGEKESEDENEDEDEDEVHIDTDSGGNKERLEIKRGLMEQKRLEIIRGYYELDPQLNSFIQPEGEEAAENLPSDLADRSAGVPYAELPKFCDRIENILNNEIPRAENEVDALEAEFRDVTSKSGMSLENACLSLESRCRKQYEKMCAVLIQEGTDQFMNALKRFGKKKHFRAANMNIKKKEWKAQVESFDVKFDVLDKKIESILRRARHLLIECSEKNGFNADMEVDFTMASDTESDQPHEAIFSANDADDDGGAFASPSWDRHAHATVSKVAGWEEQDSAPMLGKGKAVKKRRRRAGNIFRYGRKWTTDSQQHGAAKRRRNQTGGQRTRMNRSSIVSQNEGDFPEQTSQRIGRMMTGKRRSLREEVEPNSGIILSSNKVSAAKRRSNGKRLKDQKHGNRKSRERDSGAITSSGTHESNFVEDNEFAYDNEGGMELCTEDLYEDLISATSVQSNSDNSPQRISEKLKGVSTSKACQILLDEYPNSGSVDILTQLPLLNEDPTIPRHDIHAASVNIFSALLELFRRNGNQSLQEMVAMGYHALHQHICLFRCVVGLIKRNMHLHLKQSDGVLLQIFAPAKFIKMMIMQVLDVMYAQLLCKEWGSPRKIQGNAYSTLCSLRDELGSVTHPLEEICQAVLCFPCQKWYKSTLGELRQGSHSWFVSSIKPDVLSSFWRGEESFGNVRLKRFKKFCPRREIDAMWGILAWFAKGRAIGQASDLRWRLLLSLFTYKTGSLGQVVTGSGLKEILPPGNSQLKCCAGELNNVTSLLESGSMDPLPNDNGILAKLLYRSVCLYSQQVEQPMDHTKLQKLLPRKDEKIAFKAWKESDLSFMTGKPSLTEQPLCNRLLQELLSLNGPSDSIFSLSPSSLLLQNILLLLRGWFSRMPNKKARWSRFGETISSLVARLLKDAADMTSTKSTSAEVTNLNDAFAECFSNVNNQFQDDGVKEAQNAVSLCEATALMVVFILNGKNLLGVETENNFTVKVDRPFCEKVWNIIADKRMKEHLLHLLANDSILNITSRHQYATTSPSIYSSMKIFSMLMLQVLDVIEKKSQADKTNRSGGKCTDGESLTFLSSCILCTLASACERLECITHQIPFSATSLLQAMNGERTTGDVNILSCCLLWLASILQKMNIILYHSRSKPDLGNDLKLVREVLKYFHSKSLDICLVCLRRISSCASSQSSLGSCYRLCLTVLRNLVHSFPTWYLGDVPKQPVEHISCGENVDTCPNLPDCNGSIENDDLLGGIDDDFLMAIDLDNIVEKDKTCKDQAQINIDDIGGRELHNFLITSLRQAKPSTRYVIARPLSANDNPQDTPFTNGGKATCAAHSTGICALLASLSNVRELDQRSFIALLQPFQPSGNSSHATVRKEVFNNDDEFQNNVIQCLCAELCHVSKYSQKIAKMIADAKDTIIQILISALTNASVMNMFPSINFKVMLETGGLRSKEKEELFLQKATQKFEKYSQDSSQIHLDAEGFGLHRSAGLRWSIDEYFDTAGSTYMSSHLWTFCADLGLALKNASSNSAGFESILFDRLGSALIENDNDLDPYVKTICSDTLKSLPRTSLERECLKRAMKLRNVFSACLTVTTDTLTCSHGVHPLFEKIISSISSSLISGLLLELSLVQRGLEYNKRNPSSTKPYIHAKSYALFIAYSNFMSSIISWIISQPVLINNAGDETNFAFRWVILPILRSRGISFSDAFFHAANKRNIKTGRRTICFEFGLPGSDRATAHLSSNSTTDKQLFVALSRYLREFVVYAGHIERDELFYEILNCLSGLDRSLIANTVQMPLAIIDGIERKAPETDIDLGNSIELYLSLISMSQLQNHPDRKKAINRFRKYAVRSYLLPKLKHASFPVDQKINLLHLLSQILDVKRIQTEYQFHHDLFVSVGEDDTFLNLKLDIRDLICSIFECMDNAIVNGEMDATLIGQCYACLHCILNMEVERHGVCILTWCKSHSDSSNDASFIILCMEALLLLSRFFIHAEGSAALMEGYRKATASILNKKYDTRVIDDLQKLNNMVNNFDKVSKKASDTLITTNTYNVAKKKNPYLIRTHSKSGDSQSQNIENTNKCIVAFQELMRNSTTRITE